MKPVKQLFARSPQGFIASEEGRRTLCYRDNARGAYPTIGIGHKDLRLIPGVTKWTDAQIDAQFAIDYDVAAKGIASSFRQFNNLDPVRQAILVSMAFQMGVEGTMAFHHMLGAIAAQRWPEAAQAGRSSDWAVQTPERCDRAMTAMLTGQWPPVFNGESPC